MQADDVEREHLVALDNPSSSSSSSLHSSSSSSSSLSSVSFRWKLIYLLSCLICLMVGWYGEVILETSSAMWTPWSRPAPPPPPLLSYVANERLRQTEPHHSDCPSPSSSTSSSSSSSSSSSQCSLMEYLSLFSSRENSGQSTSLPARISHLFRSTQTHRTRIPSPNTHFGDVYEPLQQPSRDCHNKMESTVQTFRQSHPLPVASHAAKVDAVTEQLLAQYQQLPDDSANLFERWLEYTVVTRNEYFTNVSHFPLISRQWTNADFRSWSSLYNCTPSSSRSRKCVTLFDSSDSESISTSSLFTPNAFLSHQYYFDTHLDEIDKKFRLKYDDDLAEIERVANGEEDGDETEEDPKLPVKELAAVAPPLLESALLATSFLYRIMFDVQVMICTSSQFHRDRGDYQMKGWAGELPPTHLYFYSDDYDNEKRLPVINVMPGSGGALSKERSEIKYVHALRHGILHGLVNGRRWFFLCDDDEFMWPRNLARFIRNYQLDDEALEFYGQPCGYSYPAKNTDFSRVCGGGGWLFTRALAIRLLNILDCCFQYDGVPYSDVFISACVIGEVKGATFRPYMNLFHSQNFDKDEYWDQSIGHAITFHYANKPRENQWILYKLFKAASGDF